MEVYPAIDLRGGSAVRLERGDFAAERSYGNPAALAERFLRAGVRWLHVVDLDAARTGEPANRPMVLELARLAAGGGARVQTGGGVRTAADVEELLAGGVARVVLGTVALEDPGATRVVVTEHPGKVALGLDYRRVGEGLEVAVRGWIGGTGTSVPEVLASIGDLPWAATVVTAIDRDGTLAGPDLDGLAEVLDSTELPVVASGGVGSAADIAALAGFRSPRHGRPLAGVVTGRALVDGRLDLQEAMATCAASG